MVNEARAAFLRSGSAPSRQPARRAIRRFRSPTLTCAYSTGATRTASDSRQPAAEFYTQPYQVQITSRSRARPPFKVARHPPQPAAQLFTPTRAAPRYADLIPSSTTSLGSQSIAICPACAGAPPRCTISSSTVRRVEGFARTHADYDALREPGQPIADCCTRRSRLAASARPGFRLTPSPGRDNNTIERASLNWNPRTDTAASSASARTGGDKLVLRAATRAHTLRFTNIALKI